MPATTHKVLIIDDEPDIRELLEITLLRMGIATSTAATKTEAIFTLKEHQFDLCLCDMKLPDGSGLEIVEFIQESCPNLPVAVITAHGNMDTAVEVLKAGAFDFISKPLELERLRNLITSAFKLESVTKDAELNDDRSGLTGQSPRIVHLKEQIIKLGRSQAPVFINGESGTGKERVAKLIHAHSPRSNGPFIPVNCGAIPTELMESEFFGHTKGSFTGANSDKQGLFQAASGGTLFLDEVADLSLSMQVKLLRAIQEKAVKPVGATREISTDVRLLSATHKNLMDEVSQQRFRNDLYYRINVIELTVPPLRERKEDLSLLIEHILQSLADQTGLGLASLDTEAQYALKNYVFPGNIRELENILERAFTLCTDSTITLDDLQLNLNNSIPQQVTKPKKQEESLTASGLLISEDLTKINPHETSNSLELYPLLSPEEAFGDMEAYLGNIEKAVLMAALEKERWNKTAAAKRLGISFRTLRYRLKKFELD